MSRYTTVTAIIINKKKTKEQDIFVTLLTSHRGKITALAKGSQSIKSSRLSALQLGNISKLHLYQKNDFSWVSQATTITPFLKQRKNLAQLSLLFYFLEVINNVTVENQHTDNFFTICQNMLTAIDKNQPQKFLQNEIDLIKTLGFGLPQPIITHFQQKNFPQTQKHIQRFFESIIEKPLQSPKLFS